MADLKMLRVLAAVLALGAIALSACRESGKAGEHFEVSGKLFVFNYRNAVATYLVTLRPLKPIGNGQTAVATFENPAGGAPLVVRQKIWPHNEKLVLESPPLECVAKDRVYVVSIRIEGPDGTLMQKIETEMRSTQDQTDLPDRPLVVGPGYMPNPELAGHPDGMLPEGRGVVCPSAS